MYCCVALALTVQELSAAADVAMVTEPAPNRPQAQRPGTALGFLLRLLGLRRGTRQISWNDLSQSAVM